MSTVFLLLAQTQVHKGVCIYLKCIHCTCRRFDLSAENIEMDQPIFHTKILELFHPTSLTDSWKCFYGVPGMRSSLHLKLAPKHYATCTVR